MLKVSMLEIIIRGIPESFLMFFSIHTFSKVLINKGRYIVSSVLFIFIIYTIRCLPIKLGIHTILAMIAMIVLTVIVNKFDVIDAIKGTIITVLLEFICEILNVVIIQYVLGLDMNNAFRNNVSRLLYSSPSLIMFALVVISYYFVLLKRKDLKVYT